MPQTSRLLLLAAAACCSLFSFLAFFGFAALSFSSFLSLFSYSLRRSSFSSFFHFASSFSLSSFKLRLAALPLLFFAAALSFKRLSFFFFSSHPFLPFSVFPFPQLPPQRRIKFPGNYPWRWVRGRLWPSIGSAFS